MQGMWSIWQAISQNAVFQELIVKGLIVGVLGTALLAFLRENLGVLRTSFLIGSARRKLVRGRPREVRRAVQMLLEIARARPTRRQEMVDVIVSDFFRRHFGQNPNSPAGPTPPHMIMLFTETVRAVLSLPRLDENGHGLNIDLHQMTVRAEPKSTIYLEKANFKDVVLWGSIFEGVDFSRSTFDNADLGGVLFVRCGLEDASLSNARLSWSPFDDRATIIQECMAERSNIEDAWVLQGSRVQVEIRRSAVDGFRLDKLRSKSPGVRVNAA
jgi:hypothetical protein